MSALRLLFVEDEPWVRQAVEATLRAAEPELAITTCRDAASAASALGRGTFDAALVDLGLPDAPGTDLIIAIRRRQPACAPVAFTKFDDAPTVLAALRAGARGYLLKSIASERILPSLREAMAGGLPLSPAVASLVVSSLLPAQHAPAVPGGPAPRLTERETQLLMLLARGLTYAGCAAELGIGVGTVQSYVKSIYAKLDVSSKAEAALAAVRLGLVR